MRIHVYETNREALDRLVNRFESSPTKMMNNLIRELDRISQEGATNDEILRVIRGIRKG